MKFRSITCFGLAAFLAAQSSMAEIPAGYYDSCEGKSGVELLEALYMRISPHTDLGYGALFDLFEKSDVRPEDGSIWDMYSTKHWNASERCGNYSAIGSCFNREHSFPKSWFGGKVSPMYSDAYHLYPTDGQVNNYRGNLPFGECEGGKTWSNGSIKALGRSGTSTFPGYSGQVFEPDDEFKGDFARSYFYMATCYNNIIDDWSGEMLAGNNYPAFNDWALKMLLKWHRQDVVSQKETARQEVVSQYQHNRNPFIDYPELVEHIWGDKKSEPWYSTGAANIVTPANGSSIDLGLSAPGFTVTKSVAVSGFRITDNVSVACSGAGFSATPAVLKADDVNNGRAVVTLSYTATSESSSAGRLSLISGKLKNEVELHGRTVAGIPVYDASAITENSFTIRWVNVDGPDARYKIDVTSGGKSLDGYPAEVAASAGAHEVTGLQPETTYSFTVASATAVSAVKTVTTPASTPVILLSHEGELSFVAREGKPSDAAEIVAYIENLGSADVSVSVTAPFEVSENRSDWSSRIKLSAEADRFYLRVGGARAGRYSTVVEVSAAGCVNDETEAEAIVTASEFNETFENASEMTSYDGGTYRGIAAEWIVGAGNIWESDNDFNGTQSMRFNAKGTLTLAEPKAGGVGMISFDLRKWDNKSDKTAVVAVEYSTDGGLNWTLAGEASSDNPIFTTHSFTVNKTGEVTIRLRQTAGKRFNLDNLKLTDWAGTNGVAMIESSTWDAWSPAPGRLMVSVGENAPGTVEIAVYDVEGRIWHTGTANAGRRIGLSLPGGLYVVAMGNSSRRVAVR